MQHDRTTGWEVWLDNQYSSILAKKYGKFTDQYFMAKIRDLFKVGY
jgi:hypothetical protein